MAKIVVLIALLMVFARDTLQPLTLPEIIIVSPGTDPRNVGCEIDIVASSVAIVGQLRTLAIVQMTSPANESSSDVQRCLDVGLNQYGYVSRKIETILEHSPKLYYAWGVFELSD